MPYCKALDNHLFVSITGEFATCCNAPFQKYDTVKDFQESDYVKEVKDTMQNGWHSNCETCRLHEEKGIQSKRFMHNAFMSKYKNVDLNLSNTCNLTCRMCNSKASSKWAELLNEPNDFLFDHKQLDWPNLYRIRYNGGEPFITKQFEDIIDLCIENDVIIHVNTNATFFPKKYIDKIQKLKKFYVAFSIDGIDKVDEYIRHGTDWNKKLEIIDQWMQYKNIYFSINATIQAYNIHDYDNIIDFAKQRNLSIANEDVTRPAYLQLNALPEEYVEKVQTPNNKKYFKNYSFNEKLFKELCLKTKMHDQLLGRSLKSINPLLASYLDKYNIRSE